MPGGMVFVTTLLWPDPKPPHGLVVLDAFNDVVIARLTVPAMGKYVILARVVVYNADWDAQDVSARLCHSDGKVDLDRVDLRLIDDQRTTIHLQGTFEMVHGLNVLEIRCATYRGYAIQPSIFALEVSQVILPPPAAPSGLRIQ